MKEIYLDNAATTPVREEVMAAMNPYFSKKYGNPSSMHKLGLDASSAVSKSREEIAKVLNCSADEIIFTSGGTESVNLAIKGVAFARGKGHIITQKTEHYVVLKACEWLEKKGFKVTYLNVDKFGFVNPNDVRKAIRNDTILVTIMYANNEIGTIQSISDIGNICKEKGVLFHTDACQAAGYLDLNTKNLNVDLMTINGSKICGPKGVGLLFVKKGVKLEPLLHGGGQEFGLRSGTENVPLIVGLAKALELAQTEKNQETKKLISLRDKLIYDLLKIPGSRLNGHATKRLPNNINISFSGVEGESILLKLNALGIFASTGSACSTKDIKPSHVLLALGLTHKLAHGSIRFSLGRNTTEKDISYVLKVLPEIISELRGMSPIK
ncbi:MAG: cysteine desulfurase family protein [Candidatus Nanoarchaeia archaeon]